MFLFLLNWVSVIYCAFFAFFSVRKVLNNKYSILHIGVVLFFVMQVFPIIFESFFGIDESMSVYTNMYAAMLDEKTAEIYCLFLMFTTSCLYCLANRLLKKQKYDTSIDNAFTGIKINSIMRIIMFVGMFIPPILAVFFSPDWTIYTEFAYFYTKDLARDSDLYIYHNSVVVFANYIAFGFTMMQYLYKDLTSKRLNIDVFLAIVLFTWVDGKRALITFSLIGILAIDILKKSFNNKSGKLLKKAIIFSLVIIIYFVFYNQVTVKGDGMSFALQYETYYSRLSAVKTAIYDIMNGSRVLEYDGQSILYNIFFFVPRELWENKPVMFCKYFTAYVMNHSTTDFINWNLQVNIWTEFLSNFGFFGVFIAIAVCYFIAKITENANNMLVYLFGTLFVLFYFMFGFEILTLIAYVLWIAMLIVSKINVRIVIKI